MTMTGLRSLHVRAGHPDFLDLPWARPLIAWPGATPRVVEVERGLSRHEVQFVSYGPAVYALKEMPADLAAREYDLLQMLEERDLPAARAAGHAVVEAEDGEVQSVLVTRFVDASLPYRTLFHSPGLSRYRDRLIDAMAELLVRLHLAGVFWGDCSLSNALFRRDAGELRAYLVDAETSEVHETLSPGHRRQDLDIMEENVEGDLMDLAAQAGTPLPAAPTGAGRQVRERYEALWSEVTREETFAAGDTWRIHERVRALNAIGFSVGELELLTDGDGRRLRLRTVVTDRDYHRHEFHNLTGLVAEERQAEQALNDLRAFRATLSDELGRSVPLSVAAFRWRTERWEPTLARLQPLIGVVGDEAELFFQVLEHKWFLSESARKDVGLDAAREDYARRFASKE
jgi:hypothetical protein